MKKSKQACYDKCFERSWNNIKSIWKGNFVTNNYFASMAETIIKHKTITKTFFRLSFK